MINIVNQLSVLTTIDETALKKLVDRVAWIICDGMIRAVNEGRTSESFDLLLGVLTIDFNESQVKYRFVPSHEFEKASINAITDKENVLIRGTERALVKKITELYKELY